VVNDPFVDAQGNARVVRGIAVISNSTRVTELAGKSGFDTAWIEVEHGTLSYTEVETLCMAAEAAEMVPTVRIQDAQRTHVLRALETGARILVVALVSNAEQAQQIVEHGKFPPLGNRGFNGNSRGVGYGLEPPDARFAAANARTHLFAQIETVEGVENVDAICAVDGIAGIFIGPGDLSTSMGKCGKLSDPEVIEAATHCIRQARKAGKHGGVMAAPGPLAQAAEEAGADLMFYGSDLSILINGFRSILG
jgi:4-hydroxy-2-oxoheptanedioate aldolase